MEEIKHIEGELVGEFRYLIDMDISTNNGD